MLSHDASGVDEQWQIIRNVSKWPSAKHDAVKRAQVHSKNDAERFAFAWVDAVPASLFSGVGRQRSFDMAKSHICAFKTRLLRPAKPGKDGAWAFLVLPKAASDKLPRRGRTSVEGTINGYPFQATLDPDGQLSHWLRVSKELQEAAHADFGEMIDVQMSPATPEPEPQLPGDLREALAAFPEARAGWEHTTTLARLDWVHWVESAKLAKTRKSRVQSACDMLSSGRKRVCCFDQSGYYSKSLSAPEAVD
ncbi:MAG: YdeI/OmpD-associated family protein [Rhodanobacter sp.]